jgi:hypothetical protein
MLRKIGTVCVMLTLAMLLIAVGCGKKKKGGDEEKAPQYVSKGDEGTITGKIAFDGTPPPVKSIDMSKDANCGSGQMADDVVITEGKLANVFVYIKGGPIDKVSFPTPSDPVVLDQQGCRYHPRIFGIQINQTLKVTNSDHTTHNIHPSPKVNQEWNQMQAENAAPIEKKFTRQETLIPVVCNQHPWMRANIGVLPHPYFAVSAKDGSYGIKNVPPGTYTLVFWHEKLGEQTQTVTVAAKESKTQDITYKSGSAPAPPSMQIGPTLVLP